MTTGHIPTCDLFDRFKDAVRYVLPGLRDFGAVTRFFGPVVTVKCVEDNSRVKELLATPGDGRVLVVDGAGSLRCALMGDMIAASAVSNGWAGVVIWGCVRDVAELAALQLGIKALASMPRASTRRDQGLVDVPAELPGATVLPGDVLFADEDGIVLLTAEQAAGLK
ncbi:ribonuclease E activity regulator RraA [Azospirillum picis]|uniref:4-hydroxy-4-methyl-2-oxoglutarate aldolase n=1 Tax=Azospirillum picis TaxID=488438 RepID=A0ABU0MLE4_9PROT|nr:ribonuclease E activity regulator RraA [Azospirillum picis]MBP2301085.1 regulator of ribonuclease activity A [Azospirillum picis]MDQ0534295.1 regulator of ribonuclease activity A [Azospirillum picis]